MESFNWLHLKDLHQGMNAQGWLWPTVREDFYRDLQLLHDKSGPWDMVLFTGDLANKGKDEEYNALDELLEGLWEHLKKLGSQPVLLPIPGNHDLSRPDPKMGTVKALKLWHEDDDIKDQFWKGGDSEFYKLIEEAFASFSKWTQSSSLVPEDKFIKGLVPGDFSFTIEKGALRLGVVGLNSSFLQLTDGNYEGRLDLDVRQLHHACGGDAVRWIDQHHFVLLMTHHPHMWLHPKSQENFKAEINPPGRFALHLFGHMHKPYLHSLRVGGSAAQRYLQGASLFGLEMWGDVKEERIHGYSAGQLSAEGDMATLQIWPRIMDTLDAGHRKIIPYYKLDLDPNESVVETFKLRKSLVIPAATTDATKPSDIEQKSVIEVQKSLPAAKPYDPSNYVFFVPYKQKGAQVIGREEAIEKVRQQLTSGHRTNIGQAVAFEGLGGLGKTQLAVEYAFRFKEEYPNGAIWINADQDIEAQLIELVDQAQWIAPESDHQAKLAVARQRLRAYPNCLVIFDNVESLDTIVDYLQLLHNDTHILATSRSEWIGFEPIPIDTLDENLSYQLLIQEAHREPSGEADKEAAIEIVRSLGGLPLALELAGAYLRYRPTVEWEEYRSLLEHNLKEAFPKKFTRSTFTKHEADLYSTLKIHESLFSEAPRLKDILDILTWSGSAPMSKDLLCHLLDVKDATELVNALSLGTTLRLLNKPRDAESYAIHRLVRQVRQEDIPLQVREDWVSSTCVAIGRWFQELRSDFSNLPRYEAEIDHLKAWEQNALGFSPKCASRLIWLQAYLPFHQYRYPEALSILNRALEIYTQLQLQDLDLKAHLLNDLGTIQLSLSDFHSVLDKLKDSLKIRLELHGEKHPDVAMTLNNIGGAFGYLGKYEEELEYTQKALALWRELFGEKHPDVARALNNVGGTFGHLGRYEEQLEYYQKALALWRELFGEKHPNVAMALNNVGGTFGHLGRYEEQLEHAQKALALWRELFGEKHPDVVRALNNVGNALGHLGEYDKALEYAQKALALRRELFGEKHPDVANDLNNVGMALGDLGRHKEKLEYLQKAVSLYKEALGIFHPHTVQVTLNLASIYSNRGDREAAYRLLNPLVSQLPKNHIHYAQAERLYRSLPGLRQPPINRKKKKGKKKK